MRRTILTETRFTRPEAIAEATASRQRRASVAEHEQLLIIAADHTARGMMGVGKDAMAMESRFDLLERLCIALADPGVDGVLELPTSSRTCCCSARSRTSWSLAP